MEDGIGCAVIILIILAVGVFQVVLPNWETAVNIGIVIVALVVLVPASIWAVKKYLYLVNEPEVKVAIEQGDFDRAMTLLRTIPSANLQVVDTAATKHLEEALNAIMASNRKLEGENAQLRERVRMKLQISSSNLEDRLQAARDSGMKEEYAKAVLEQLAKTYGMRVVRD